MAVVKDMVRRLGRPQSTQALGPSESSARQQPLVIHGDVLSFDTLPPAILQDRMEVPKEEWLQFHNVKMERSLHEYLQNDMFPIPTPADREGYFGDRHYHYWLSGLKDYLSIKGALDQMGSPLESGSVVLDLGCASGRVLRHFACHEKGGELWGADINIRHVEWVRRFLDPSIRILPATIVPHLPIEDNTCSLVYAFSVFTHIDELELAWIAEIKRILRRGGIAYLTIHSDHTWNSIQSARPLYESLLTMKDHIREYHVTPELFAKPMPNEKTVFKWTAELIYNANVFHSTNYIKKVWGRYLEVVDIVKEGHNYQDVVILRRK